MECTYLQGGARHSFVLRNRHVCIAASLREEECVVKLFYRVFWPCLERGDGLTALPKQSSISILREIMRRARTEVLQIHLQMVKATGYMEHTVRRDVAEKSEISVATLIHITSQTLQLEKDHTG